MADPRPLRPGDPERLGDYRLLGFLGEGGQGAVYFGRNRLGEPVAIKVLHARFAEHDESRRRFFNEVEVARKVAEFCTARVIAAEITHERPYIVSEYVDGESLEDLVRKGGPRDAGSLDRIAVGTIAALAAIHRAGIVHRDFKPGNVLLGPDGPRVIDFGIAQVVDAAGTLASRVQGTPAYMSPEQLAGTCPGAASDVFSWAVTLTFAATGRPAFGSDTIPAVMNRIMNREPDLSYVPARLRHVLHACLTKDAAGRPTAAQVLLALVGHEGHPDRTPTQPDVSNRHAVTPYYFETADLDGSPEASQTLHRAWPRVVPAHRGARVDPDGPTPPWATGDLLLPHGPPEAQQEVSPPAHPAPPTGPNPPPGLGSVTGPAPSADAAPLAERGPRAAAEGPPGGAGRAPEVPGGARGRRAAGVVIGAGVAAVAVAAAVATGPLWWRTEETGPATTGSATRAAATSPLETGPAPSPMTIPGAGTTLGQEYGERLGAAFRRHTGDVLSVAAGAVGSRVVVASAGQDGRIRVSDLLSGKPYGPPGRGAKATGALRLSGLAVTEVKGQAVVVCGGYGKGLWLSDLATGLPMKTARRDGDVLALAVSDLGGHPVAIASDYDAVHVTDLVTGRTILDRGGGATTLSIGVAGGRPVVVAAGLDGSIHVWDLATGNDVGSPYADAGAVLAAGDLGGRAVIVSSADGSGDPAIVVRDAVTGAVVSGPWHGHTDRISALTITDLGGTPIVVSGSWDGTIRTWRLSDGTPAGPPIKSGWVSSLAVTHVGGRPAVIAGDDHGAVRAWTL
ncbi:protein kinase [Streptosporangiaceae bacterium NEAU-GS5]|nr:protein kinase [Streptosporangiaceae bacterium NEAU-GS5]